MSNWQKLVLGAALWLTVPAVLRADGWVQAPSGDHGWWAVESGGETCVSDRSGERVSCWADTGRLTDLREVTGGWIGAGRRADSESLFLVRDHGKGVEHLALPSAPLEASNVPRGRPNLVTDDTRLLGLVWLEGSTQAELQVRAAEWLGDGWNAPVTVSPTGPGSQVAPRVTVLGDGRWLLVWTAYDGEDDETVFSLFDHGRWSKPAPVHEDNDSPDILPTLVTTRRGAIAAWSWLDGRDYRLRTAFFDGTDWRVDPSSGGRGSLEARFVATSGAYLLGFETVVPEEWVAWEFDDTGRVLGWTSIPREGVERPLIDFVGNGALFRWPAGDAPREVTATWKREP